MLAPALLVVAYGVIARDALRLFLVFASERAGKPPSRLRLEDLDRDVVLAFLNHLEQERNNSVSTRNVRLTAIRSFVPFQVRKSLAK